MADRLIEGGWRRIFVGGSAVFDAVLMPRFQDTWLESAAQLVALLTVSFAICRRVRQARTLKMPLCLLEPTSAGSGRG